MNAMMSAERMVLRRWAITTRVTPVGLDRQYCSTASWTHIEKEHSTTSPNLKDALRHRIQRYVADQQSWGTIKKDGVPAVASSNSRMLGRRISERLTLMRTL